MTQHRKLRALELGRFFAALMVMLSHVLPYVNAHAANPSHLALNGFNFPGPLGVQYFFVLSGFVMASAHHADFGRPFAPLKFWWRRACRIYPAYWLALCIPAYFLFGAMTPGLTLHLALLDPWHNTDYIPAAWSLRYEMAFYIMFGLALLPYIGKPILVLWILLTFWHCILPTQPVLHPQFSMPFYWFLQDQGSKFTAYMEFFFFAGLGAGFLYARLQPGRRASIALMAASAGIFLALLPVEDWGRSYSVMPPFIVLMAMVIGANILGLALLERHDIIRLGKAASWAGAVSYPIYVFHEPILLFININFPWALHHPIGLYARLGAIIAAILATAALVTIFYDQPLQHLLRRAAGFSRQTSSQRLLPGRGKAG